MNSVKKGFTLIELLVVIAIIGILSGIVIVSLGSARDKADDAAIKGNLSGIRATAELYRDENGNKYASAAAFNCTSGLFADARIKSAIDASATASGQAATCAVSTTAYAVSVKLKGTGYFCIDNNGSATTTAAVGVASGDYTCG